MQVLVSCDYFRTPAIFRVPDIYRFVGSIKGHGYLQLVEMISRGDLLCEDLLRIGVPWLGSLLQKPFVYQKSFH